MIGITLFKWIVTPLYGSYHCLSLHVCQSTWAFFSRDLLACAICEKASPAPSPLWCMLAVTAPPPPPPLLHSEAAMHLLHHRHTCNTTKPWQHRRWKFVKTEIKTVETWAHNENTHLSLFDAIQNQLCVWLTPWKELHLFVIFWKTVNVLLLVVRKM